jgi:hypothetical protein
MEVLHEMNQSLATALLHGCNKGVSDYVAHMRTTVASLRPSAAEMEQLLENHASGRTPCNSLATIQINRSYLEAMRLAAVKFFAGRTENLVVYDIDIASAGVLASLTNQQILALASHYPGEIFVSRMEDVLAGKEMHPEAAAMHAVSLGDSVTPGKQAQYANHRLPKGLRSPVIPESASLDDPRWSSALRTLAEDMILAGAKPKIIERYTGIRHATVTGLYRILTNRTAPSGPVAQGRGLGYVNVRRFSYPQVIQNAIFANCYLRLKRLVGEPANLGWLLVHSYRTYVELIGQSEFAENGPSLDINSAFSMVTYIGLDCDRAYGALGLATCGTCNVAYLILTAAETEQQTCPVCAYNGNLQRLQRGVPRTNQSTG